MTLEPTTGSALFPFLSGYIKQDVTDAGPVYYISAEFTADASAGCYTGSNAIPGTGQVQGNQLGLSSFSVNGQYLTLDATLGGSADTLTGTYNVSGGCANGAQGTISGTRYSPLTGTYGGSLAADSAETLQLVLSQNSLGNGNGQFQVSGSATFAGFPCFTTGALGGSAGLITGDSAQLTFSTSDPAGAQVVLQGTIDPAADTMTLSSVNVTAGNCAGAYGTATLTLQ